MKVFRWVLAAVGWFGPNALLLLALASIPPTESHGPAGTTVDWVAGSVVIPVFLAAFFAVGMLSIRLALHAAPEDGRPGLAKLGRWGSLAWLALILAIGASGTDPEDSMGSAAFLVWGLGHLLGARWKTRSVDRGN